MSIFKLNTYFDMIENNKIDEAINYRNSFVPEYIYKYVSLSDDSKTNEKKFESILNNQIWLSSYNCLNDPYEFFGMYIRKEELLEKGMSIQDIDSIIALMQSVFVASFSGNLANNLPMWAHYANNHKGLCLKYKVNNKMTIRNVIYESKPIDITKIFIKFIEYRDTIEKNVIETDNIELFNRKFNIYATIMQDLYAIKHNSWEYENEYRIIYPKCELEMKLKGENVLASDCGLELTEVYCGIKCSEDNMKKVLSICESLNVTFKVCKKSMDEFTVFE